LCVCVFVVMMRLVIVALSVVAVLVAAADVKCYGTVSDTKNHRSYKFDLSSLHHDDTAYVDTLWYRTDDNVVYYVNFCGQTASACESADTSVCIRIPHGEDYRYAGGGKTSTQKISIAEAPDQSPSSSVTVTYSDGESCGSGNYKTRIFVNCQHTANPGYFYNIDQPNPCEATLYMWAVAGCGQEVPYVEPSDEEGSDEEGSKIPLTGMAAVVVGIGYFIFGLFMAMQLLYYFC